MSKAKLANIEFEKNCQKAILNKEYEKCADRLINEIRAIVNSKKDLNNNRTVRLSDFLVRVLMFLIYRKGSSKYHETYNDFLKLVDNSNNLILKKRKENWSNPNYKWLTISKQAKSIIKWDKKMFT